MNLAFCKLLAVLMGLILHVAKGQLNPIFATSAPGGSGSNTNNVFYFDSKSDCNTGVRNLFGKQATIIGSNQTASSTSSGVTTCTIILKSEGTYDGTILDINVVAMNILDCLTQVSIYDGEGANILLSSFDCRSSQNANRRQFVTSKNTATFIMNRPTPNSYNFDVKITVDPISSGPVIPTGGYNLVDFTKFPQEGIVGMIGGFYFFVLGICCAIIYSMNRSFKGANAKWETHELANVKTGLNFDSKSQLNRPVQIATLEGMKNRELVSQYSRSATQPTVRKTAPPSEDGDSGVYYNEETFQRKQLMTRERENVKNRFVANTAFSDQDDDPDNFKEKIIIPSKHIARNRKPPAYDEAVSDQTSEHSSDEESEVSSKRSRSSEDEESERSSVRSRSSERSSVRSSQQSRSTARTRSTRSPTPSETESEEESCSDVASSRGHRGKHRQRKPKQKHHPEQKRSHRPNGPRQPPPQTAQQIQQPPLRAPMYGGAYPPGPYVPVMAGPAPFQPIPLVPGYPPPRYSVQPQAAPPPREPQIQPTDIPVYSYLVQRGYKPIDDLNLSHASTDSHRSGGQRLENPDVRLGSGVEYMKR